MYYIKFTDEVPYKLKNEFLIEAHNRTELETVISNITKKPCSILFIDCIDNTENYDTIISVDHNRYNAFCDELEILK